MSAGREWRPIQRNMLREWLKLDEYAVVDEGQDEPPRRGFKVEKITEKYIHTQDGGRHSVDEFLEHGTLGGLPVLDPRDPASVRYNLLARCETAVAVMEMCLAASRRQLNEASPDEAEKVANNAESIQHWASRLIGEARRLKEHLEGKTPARRPGA